MWVWDVCDHCMPNHGSGILHVYNIIVKNVFTRCSYNYYSGGAAYILTKSLLIFDLHVLSYTIIEVFLIVLYFSLKVVN